MKGECPASWLRLYLEAWSRLLVRVGTSFGLAVFLETDVVFAAKTDVFFALADAGTGASCMHEVQAPSKNNGRVMHAPLQKSFLRVWGVAECLQRSCPSRFLSEFEDKRVIFHTHLCCPKSLSDRICIAI